MPKITRRISTVAASVAATLALSAAGASAAISVSPSTVSSPSSPVSVTITAPPAGAAFYAVAQCDTTNGTPLNWGRDCNQTATNRYTSLEPVTTFPATHSLVVDQSFTNASFGGGAPLYGPTTSCTTASTPGRPCASVVSWYDATVTPITAERALLTFTP